MRLYHNVPHIKCPQPVDQEALMTELCVILVSGFLQKPHGVTNGINDLRKEVKRRSLGLPNVELVQMQWNDNAHNVVQRIWEDRPKGTGQKQRYLLVAYSYGAQKASEIARELSRRGDCEITIYLCDPVRRHPLIRGVMAWFGLGSFRFWEPPVKKVVVYKQRNMRRSFWRAIEEGIKYYFQPQGHDVYHKGKLVEPVVIPKVTHQYIDNSGTFQLGVLAEVERQLQWAKDLLGG